MNKFQPIIISTLVLLSACEETRNPEGNNQDTIINKPAACNFFIALDGDDAMNGTSKITPFATLERARTAIRYLKNNSGLPEGGVNVCLAGGIYERNKSFELTSEDSGEEGKPVVYRSINGESARITGAISLADGDFSRVTATKSPNVYNRIDPITYGHLMQIELSKYTTNYGKLVSRGGTKARDEVAALELFVNKKRMTLARWPDENEKFPFLITGSVNEKQYQFKYSGNRPNRWSKAEEIWMHGLWRWYWSDKHVLITSLDTSSNSITFAKPKSPYYGLGEGQPYYVQNLLEEITVPGEWYLNRDTGILYLWPIEPLNSTSEIMVSLLDQPLVKLTNTSHIKFENLNLEMNRSFLVEINEGSHNVIKNSSLLHGGIDGVIISGGKHNGLDRCEVTDIGNVGIILSGGDRRKLINTENFVRNSHIHDVGYWSWTSIGAIRMEETVGVTIANNHIYNTNYNAIGFGGNNNIIEYNDIHHTNRWSGDGGAIYTGRRWDWRGNIIRYNFIHDIQTGFIEKHGVHGIYLDDSIAGVLVFGNIINKVQGRAINARGGRDTIIQNNVLTNNGIAISADMAGIHTKPTILDHLINMPYQEEPWASSYPEAAVIPKTWNQIIESDWRYPSGSIIQHNVGFGNTKFFREGNYDGTGVFNKYQNVSDNLDNVDILYINESIGDFRLHPDSPIFQIDGFENISFENIGIRP